MLLCFWWQIAQGDVLGKRIGWRQVSGWAMVQGGFYYQIPLNFAPNWW
jgi:hypothetical protein